MSVPGLTARPVMDILLGLRNGKDRSEKGRFVEVRSLGKSVLPEGGNGGNMPLL